MILSLTKLAAFAAASAAMPRESCGLVVITNGQERYWPCENIAPDESDFAISPVDYLSATQAGKITGIIHSHPNGFPTPTPADLASCEKWGIPWHIVSPQLDPPHGRWHSFEPTGFKAPLLGREWVWGIHDCWSLVRDWYGENGIALQDFDRPLDPDQFLKAPLFESLFPEAGFYEVSRDQARPGDAVLMALRSKGLNHVGVLDKSYRLLHHVQGRLSSLDLYGDGLQKATGKVVRHVDCDRLKVIQCGP
ncbi:MAG: C40 family peptidase [Synechococcus sp. ELA619]